MNASTICDSHTLARGDLVTVTENAPDATTWYDAVVVAVYPDVEAYAVVHTRHGHGPRRAVIHDDDHEDGTRWATPYDDPQTLAHPIPAARCHHCGAQPGQPCTTTCPLTIGTRTT